MKMATQNLESDHVNIIQLTKIMQQMVRARATDVNQLKTVVKIIRNYADGLHHKKEEELLFPLFEEKGAGGHFGPVRVMLMEHEQGRQYVKSIIENISDYENGNKAALELVYENMLGYAELLQNHIYKENNILFKMANIAFSEEDQKMLLGKFDKIESDAEEGSKIQDYVSTINNLAFIYAI